MLRDTPPIACSESDAAASPQGDPDLRETLAFISHELRNPLHAITLQLAVARAMVQGTEQAELAARLARLQTLLARYSQRVTMLLDLTAPGTTDLTPRPQSVDLAALLHGLADAALPEARQRGITIEVATPAPCHALLDPQLLEQVVENLMFNAFKHAQCSRVSLRLQPLAGLLRLEVADDGQGIAQEDQARIFGKHAVARSTHRGEGKGLGLWIVRRLVQLMGGSVSVSSELAVGTIFRVELPFAAAEEPT